MNLKSVARYKANGIVETVRDNFELNFIFSLCALRL
jgi:hypothetical protein